jgi:hypothetical protein
MSRPDSVPAAFLEIIADVAVEAAVETAVVVTANGNEDAPRGGGT